MNDQPRSRFLEGDALVIGAMSIFGSYALFLRELPGISTLAFIFAFQVVGCVVLFLVRRKFDFLAVRPYIGWLIVLAIVCLGNDLFYFIAFRKTSVANAAIAHQSVSIFLLLLAPLLLKERTQKDEWIALAVALIGFVILYSKDLSFHSGSDAIGITFGVISGLCYALLIVLYRVIPAKGLNIRTINFWRYFFGVICLLPFISLMHVSSIHHDDLALLVAFGILFAVIASGIHNLGISRTRSLHASILGKSEPVFAIVYAWIFLSEAPSLRTIIAGVLIIGASIWLALRAPAARTDAGDTTVSIPDV